MSNVAMENNGLHKLIEEKHDCDNMANQPKSKI